MNKEEFFQKLGRSLKGLPKTEIDTIMADFEEHFMNSVKEGRSEDETAEMLGNPAAIGRIAKTELLMEEAETKGSARSVFRAVMAAAGLGLFNIIIVIGPFFGIVGALIGLWAAAAGVGLSGVATLGVLFFSPFVRSFIPLTAAGIVFTLFTGIGLAAFGGLLGIGMVYLTKWFAKLTLAYAKATVGIVKGK